MSKKWIVVSVVTLFLLLGMWILYTYQSEEEIPDISELSQLVPSVSETAETTYQEVTLFVMPPETGTLVRTVKEILEQQELVAKITQTIEYLMHPDEETQNVAIPEETALISVFVTNSGIAYINFNRHIQDHHTGGLSAELATVTSVVNTLLFNFQEIKQVQILVEGAEIETLAGHVDCRKPFSKMFLVDS